MPRTRGSSRAFRLSSTCHHTEVRDLARAQSPMRAALARGERRAFADDLWAATRARRPRPWRTSPWRVPRIAMTCPFWGRPSALSSVRPSRGRGGPSRRRACARRQEGFAWRCRRIARVRGRWPRTRPGTGMPCRHRRATSGVGRIFLCQNAPSSVRGCVLICERKVSIALR